MDFLLQVTNDPGSYVVAAALITLFGTMGSAIVILWRRNGKNGEGNTDDAQFAADLFKTMAASQVDTAGHLATQTAILERALDGQKTILDVLKGDQASMGTLVEHHVRQEEIMKGWGLLQEVSAREQRDALGRMGDTVKDAVVRLEDMQRNAARREGGF